MNAKRRSAGAEGHYLKWMLALMVIAILLALLVPGVSANWWRSEVTIDNSGGGALTNYQVLVSITDHTHMDNGDSIRFTNIANSTKYDYWIESWNVGDTSKIWVEVPSIAAGASPTMYLWSTKDTGPSPESNGDATFRFFDGFSGDLIDTSKWTKTDGTGWSVSGGKLNGTDTRGRLTSTSAFSDGVILEIKSKYEDWADHGYMIGGFFLSTSNAFGFLKQKNNDFYRNDTYWLPLSGLGLVGTELLTKISVKSASSVDLSVTNYDSGTSYHSVSDAPNTVSGEPIVLGKRYDDNPDYPEGYKAYWDWIRVRKYASSEPTTSVDVAEDAGGGQPVPELSTIILFSVGLIVLAGYVSLRRREKKKGK